MYSWYCTWFATDVDKQHLCIPESLISMPSFHERIWVGAFWAILYAMQAAFGEYLQCPHPTAKVGMDRLDLSWYAAHPSSCSLKCSSIAEEFIIFHSHNWIMRYPAKHCNPFFTSWQTTMLDAEESFTCSKLDYLAHKWLGMGSNQMDLHCSKVGNLKHLLFSWAVNIHVRLCS